MLSSHENALEFNKEGVCAGLRICAACDEALLRNNMPKFAIANGFFCGDVNHLSTDFPSDVTEQEWKIMSLIVTRMQVRRIWGVEGGSSARNGIRGPFI